MDSINRLLVSLAAIAVTALFVVAILAVTGGIEPETYNAWFESELRELALLGQPWKAMSVAAALAGIGLMLLLLAFQVRGGGRRREAPLLVSSTDLGRLSVDPASIRTLVEHTGMTNRSVVDLQCRLSVRRKTPPGGPTTSLFPASPAWKWGRACAKSGTTFKAESRKWWSG